MKSKFRKLEQENREVKLVSVNVCVSRDLMKNDYALLVVACCLRSEAGGAIGRARGVEESGRCGCVTTVYYFIYNTLLIITHVLL